MEDQIQTELLELEEELRKLKSAVDYIEGAKKAVESAEGIIKATKYLQENFTDLQNNTGHLIKKIDKVDFPLRLDKLDTTLSGINLNISNSQSRIEASERNLLGNIESKTKDILEVIKENQNAVLKLLDSHTAAMGNLKSQLDQRSEAIQNVLTIQGKEIKLLKYLLIIIHLILLGLGVKLFI